MRIYESKRRKEIMMLGIAALLAVAFMPAPAAAEIEYTNKCYGNLLAKESNLTIGSNTIELNNTRICEYGCDIKNNMCRPPPIATWLIVAVVLVSILIVGGAIIKFS